ncbi:Ent-kaurene synthase [Bertholletia excelsa]
MSETQTSLELPVLDISQPIDRSSLSSLSLACRELGFFRISNHGVSRDIYMKLHSISSLLFSLSPEFKLRLGPSSALKTYTPHFIASPFYESFRVAGPDFFASAQSVAQILNCQSSELSEVLSEYGNQMTEISKKVVDLILICLGKEFERKFESQFQNCHGYLRIINYTRPDFTDKEEVEGLGMHTDMSCVTIVYQDETGGLQVRSKEGKWMDIDPCDETLVVNIGDLMQAWSNGRLRSSQHRVVLKRPVNRFSLAFFWCFEDDKVILAPDEVVGEGNLRIYKPFVCAKYLKFRENSERGKFEKIGYTVQDFAGTEE